MISLNVRAQVERDKERRLKRKIEIAFSVRLIDA